MKITNIKAIPLSAPINQIADALSVVSQRKALIVIVETDSVLYGIGEAFSYGAPVEALKIIIETQLAPLLVNEDPLDIDFLWSKMYWNTIANGRVGVVKGAISGIDIALWDILGKYSKLPIYKLLGGVDNKVPSYASGGFYANEKGLDKFKTEIEGYLNKGYKDVKIKIGRNPEIGSSPLKYIGKKSVEGSWENDIRRIEVAHRILGGNNLIVDMNGSWTGSQLISNYELLKSNGVKWVEEPIVCDDFYGYLDIKNKLKDILICGFESEQGEKAFKRWVKAGVIDIVQPDISWAGGFSEVKKIADMSKNFNKPVSLHSFGSAIHFAATLHMAGGISNKESIESEENFNPLKSDLINESFLSDENMNFYASEKPGLGITLDWDKVEKYRIK